MANLERLGIELSASGLLRSIKGLSSSGCIARAMSVFWTCAACSVFCFQYRSVRSVVCSSARGLRGPCLPGLLPWAVHVVFISSDRQLHIPRGRSLIFDWKVLTLLFLCVFVARIVNNFFLPPAAAADGLHLTFRVTY